MRKISLILLMIMCAGLTAYAPRGLVELPVLEVPPIIHPMDELIKAIVFVEVGDGSDLYNELEDAVGHFQIRPMKLSDYNKWTGRNYLLSDMYDYNKAIQVFLYFASMYDDWETIARRWNGSGPLTDIYWDKVKAKLNENESAKSSY